MTRILTVLLLAISLFPQASFAAPAVDPELHFEFAFRDSSSQFEYDRRAVVLQGSRESGSPRIERECGATGARCDCLFYRNETDSAPLQSASSGFSSALQTYSCTTPGDQNQPNAIHFVALRKRSGQLLSGQIRIQTQLKLEDVLGKLDKNKVRGIFRYSCSRTFFEGEGVGPAQIMCVAGQRLGVISASYNFYTYRSNEDANQPGGDVAFPDSICGRNSFLKIQCTGNAPELRYGFYKESAGPFVVGITMTRAPEGENLTSNYGFAALPDSAGHCAPGLVKVRPWVAQPASIVEGSLGNGNPPSNFINENSSLNNTVVDSVQPANFVVTRQPNQVPCAADGNCWGATFGGTQQAQNVMYTALTPVVCAIPASLLGGLF